VLLALTVLARGAGRAFETGFTPTIRMSMLDRAAMDRTLVGAASSRVLDDMRGHCMENCLSTLLTALSNGLLVVDGPGTSATAGEGHSGSVNSVIAESGDFCAFSSGITFCIFFCLRVFGM
jgi:hypothetical protein